MHPALEQLKAKADEMSVGDNQIEDFLNWADVASPSTILRLIEIIEILKEDADWVADGMANTILETLVEQ